MKNSAPNRFIWAHIFQKAQTSSDTPLRLASAHGWRWRNILDFKNLPPPPSKIVPLLMCIAIITILFIQVSVKIAVSALKKKKKELPGLRPLNPYQGFCPLTPTGALKLAPGPLTLRLAHVARRGDFLLFEQALLNQWGTQPSLAHGHPQPKLRHYNRQWSWKYLSCTQK